MRIIPDNSQIIHISFHIYVWILRIFPPFPHGSWFFPGGRQRRVGGRSEVGQDFAGATAHLAQYLAKEGVKKLGGQGGYDIFAIWNVSKK